MATENITDQFIDNICSITYDSIPLSAIRKLKECIVDTIGATIAGSAELKDKEIGLLNTLITDGCVIYPIGHQLKTSLSNAILINGLSSHYLELDDGTRQGVIHPSAPILSALIPIGIINKVTWKRFVLGAICGYETAIRIAQAMQPSHYSLGYHPTATCCTLGVAVAITVMLSCDKQLIKDSLSSACISASGSLKVIEDDSQLKPYNCAKAALMGYYAAMLAIAGFRGPNNCLDGDLGFLNMMSSSWDKSILLNKESSLKIENIYTKPYASCRHTHPEIEAALSIRKAPEFKFDKVDRIKVITYAGVIGKHDTYNINSVSAARMSIPFSVVVALYCGKAGIDEFSKQYYEDTKIRELLQRVEVIADQEITKLVPSRRAAIVEVYLNNGTILRERVDYPKGEPENPMSETDLLTKFISLCNLAGISSSTATQFFNYIMHSQIIDINALNYGEH